MRNILGLTLILTIFWLINSGYFKPLLLGFCVLSVAAVIALTWRMKHEDNEFFPSVMPSFQLPGYLLWMVKQIIIANIDVVKHVWFTPSSIDPVVFKTRASQKSEVGRVLYANSITMTPGTVTLFVQDNALEVHALNRKAAKDLQEGEMDRRVSMLEA